MKHWRQIAKKRTGIIIVALLFAAAGIYFTLRLLAAPVGVIVEVGTEPGATITPPAKLISDAGASGGQAVQFTTDTPIPGSAYNTKILADRPVLFLPMVASGATEKDLGSGNHTAAYKPGTPAKSTLPNGDPVAVFNGNNNYLEVNDANDLSITNKGVITIEAWMRPDVLNFPKTSGDGYAHWMGKGTAGQHEYVSRMYNKDTGRPNRISGYAYNAAGGEGAGSYFQDAIAAGQWIHYTLIIDTVHTSGAYPTGFVKIYKNGAARDQDSLIGYNIHPTNGTAPFRVGTRDFVSGYFLGAIGKVAMYDYALSDAQIMAHYQAMK